MKLRHLLLALTCVVPSFAQVDFTAPGPSVVAQYGQVGGNLAYICYASAVQPPTVFPVSGAATLTNIAVAANVGTITFSSTSYLWVGQRVIVSGSTTSTALNGTYKITAVSGVTATITTAGVSNATYSDSTMYLSTTAPMLNATVWAIQEYTYSGTTVTGSYWAGTPGPYIPINLACSNAANY